MLVTEYDPAVKASTTPERPVLYSSNAAWSELASAPPGRLGHSAVVHEDSMYLFGGERSAYVYEDVWRYDFAQDTWEYQAPTALVPGLARHDHSAVVYNGTMYVYGGRSPAAQGDFWAYDMRARTWMAMPTSEGMAPRFSHQAAVQDNKMYVFGGYVGAEAGSLTNEIWEFSFEEMAWTKVGPRQANNVDSWNLATTDSILLQQPLPAARFASAGAITGIEPALYVMGGAGGDTVMEAQSDLWKFDLGRREWTLMASDADELLARYDSAAALISDGTLLVLYGGRATGDTHQADVVIMHVGETGLSK
jgi:N-acetylneuraminic acid mutarotase